MDEAQRQGGLALCFSRNNKAKMQSIEVTVTSPDATQSIKAESPVHAKLD